MKIASAAKKFEVSRSTLQNWLKNTNEEKTEIFDTNAEATLVKYLEYCNNFGFSTKRKCEV